MFFVRYPTKFINKTTERKCVLVMSDYLGL